MLRSRACRCSTLPILYYPTKRDGPRHRFPDSDLRLVDAARPVASQRVLLGDQPQPGRHAPARLVLEDRPGRRQRIPLQRRRRTTATSARYCSTISTRRPTRGATARRATPSDRAATRSAAAPTSCCPRHLRARASVNYFSSIATSQTFNTNIYDASRNQRSFGGNVVGAWGTYSLNATHRSQRVFLQPHRTRSSSGSWPRVALTPQRAAAARTRRRYFSVGTEFVSTSLQRPQATPAERSTSTTRA